MFGNLFNHSREKGQHYERVAETFLNKQGLKSITRNYLCRYGEIDLIMKDGDTWVFIEVKFRRGGGFGGALQALSQSKLQKLRRSIYNYLQQSALHNVPLRIDFVAIQGDNNPDIQWIRNIT
ncbi:YraN family protein [Pseudoalteromonas sp. R3]|jgi:putative endonuclease|uniref:YraN family protein n=1 Tax=Pseudoalteromonas sp. R3 TaxID=1709477 RepID=UPI0006B46C9A|nr:YraN family protein [Pseudoalteromonas sp. R3]AZZ96915.1 YraN family protein [Pseudoalteromonas sp. R3]